MAKFRFRLEKVLTLRKEELRAREGDLISAQAEVTKIEVAIQRIIDASNKQLIQEGSILSAEEYLLRGTALERFRKELESARGALTEAQEILTTTRERYVEAKKEVKVLEKLREKKLTVFESEVAKKEQDFIDEVSVMRGNKASI